MMGPLVLPVKLQVVVITVFVVCFLWYLFILSKYMFSNSFLFISFRYLVTFELCSFLSAL